MKKVLALLLLCFTLSGCYMVPLALLGPATSGFTSASILQATLTTTANGFLKKTTGKSISEHAIDSINQTVIKQGYVSIKEEKVKNIYPKVKPKKI